MLEFSTLDILAHILTHDSRLLHPKSLSSCDWKSLCAHFTPCTLPLFWVGQVGWTDFSYSIFWIRTRTLGHNSMHFLICCCICTWCYSSPTRIPQGSLAHTFLSCSCFLPIQSAQVSAVRCQLSNTWIQSNNCLLSSNLFQHLLFLGLNNWGWDTKQVTWF